MQRSTGLVGRYGIELWSGLASGFGLVRKNRARRGRGRGGHGEKGGGILERLRKVKGE
jgi:hypothetical protein